MKHVLQIILIVALLSLGIIQIMIAKGFFIPRDLEKVCPVDAITMVNGKAVIDPIKCIGCRRCVDGIPIRKNDPRPIEIPLADSVAAILPAQPASPIVSPPHSNPQKPNPPAQTVLSYRVDSSKCIGCQLCVSACPTGAISMQGEKAVIDQSKCISCGICVNGNGQDYDGCPVSAISRR